MISQSHHQVNMGNGANTACCLLRAGQFVPDTRAGRFVLISWKQHHIFSFFLFFQQEEKKSIYNTSSSSNE